MPHTCLGPPPVLSPTYMFGSTSSPLTYVHVWVHLQSSHPRTCLGPPPVLSPTYMFGSTSSPLTHVHVWVHLQSSHPRTCLGPPPVLSLTYMFGSTSSPLTHVHVWVHLQSSHPRTCLGPPPVLSPTYMFGSTSSPLTHVHVWVHLQSSHLTALERTGSTGWGVKVELKSSDSVATCKFRVEGGGRGWLWLCMETPPVLLCSCSCVFGTFLLPILPPDQRTGVALRGRHVQAGTSDLHIRSKCCNGRLLKITSVLFTVQFLPPISLQDDISGYTLPADTYTVSHTGTWSGD